MLVIPLNQTQELCLCNFPLQALGDKIGSTIIAQSAGVPCIQWNGDTLRVDIANAHGVIPPEVYRQANVDTACKAIEVRKLSLICTQCYPPQHVSLKVTVLH